MKKVNKENMKYIQEELDKPFSVALLSMVSKFKVAILAWFLVSSAQIISGMVSLSHGISWLHTHHCISGRLIVAMIKKKIIRQQNIIFDALKQ